MEGCYKIGVFGSSEYDDKVKIYDILNRNIDKIEFIVSNNSRGPSQIAQEWAKQKGVAYLTYYVGEGGSSYRNNLRALGACDIVVVFNKGGSKGATLIQEIAAELNKDVRIIKA